MGGDHTMQQAVETLMKENSWESKIVDKVEKNVKLEVRRVGQEKR